VEQAVDGGVGAGAKPGLAASGPSRGTNQTGVRLYNERLVLSLIREHRSFPKADVARLTGLSPQTISGIVNQLSKDGLLLKGKPQRGRVGQPSVPYSLNPEGAYFVGMKIGRRSSDLVLLDFLGRVLRKFHQPHAYSSPDQTLALIRRGSTELVDVLTPTQRARIAGFGIASPFELWNWEPQFGAPASVLKAWHEADILGDARRISPWPVYLHNDGTAACAAELVLGQATTSADFLYIFIGSFIGGGVVLNHHLYPGRSRYAGAIGPMPIPVRGKPGFQQVLRSASLYVLGEKLTAMGGDPAVLTRDPDNWGEIGAPLEDWLDSTARDLALTIVSAVSVIDFETIVIDGAFPTSLRRRLVEATRLAIGGFDMQGVSPFSVVEGSIGSGAREIGGACLALLANFSKDREVLFKE
jgi:predicted NBD/HSP70 family sugar kinase